MTKLTDESLMPFGKYKGKKMANVPAYYLLYIYDGGLMAGPVYDYIQDNIDALKQEIKK